MNIYKQWKYSILMYFYPHYYRRVFHTTLTCAMKNIPQYAFYVVCWVFSAGELLKITWIKFHAKSIINLFQAYHIEILLSLNICYNMKNIKWLWWRHLLRSFIQIENDGIKKEDRKKESPPIRLDFNKSRPSPFLAYITITDSDESSHVFCPKRQFSARNSRSISALKLIYFAY